MILSANVVCKHTDKRISVQSNHERLVREVDGLFGFV